MSALGRPGPGMARVDFAPLERFARAPSVAVLAAQLGVTTTTVHRLRSEGIHLDAADSAASALGAHPTEIWPWFDEIEPYWCASPWLRRRRTQAVLDAWRQRLDCSGIAGELARRMFNVHDDEGDAA